MTSLEFMIERELAAALLMFELLEFEPPFVSIDSYVTATELFMLSGDEAVSMVVL